MSVSEGMRKYGSCLSPYERHEISSYPVIYYCGQGCTDKINAPTTGPNDGYDTSDGEYIFHAKDHIAYRYEILEELGSGAFGQVLKAIDHADEQIVAVKLIRNERKILQQSAQEIKILEHVNSRDPKNLYGVVRMIENFSFRGHICISYELLGTNLYEYLKEKDFYPMALSLVRGIAARMLIALTFLARENIMHCDLKPENILIRGSDPSVVKLVDLGSASFDASFDAHNSFMYIQSRFYRAPEVILEQKYTKAIDWWSFGCILCELANGDPVFPGDDEKDQLGCIMEYLGPPPQSFIEASSARRKREFFDGHLQPRERQTKKGRVRVPGSKSLAKFLGVREDDDFLSFVMQFLQWDPAARVSPRDAMRHKWIREEFVFPTNTEDKSTAAVALNAEASSLAVAPESKEGDTAAMPVGAAHGKPVWQARGEATAGVAAIHSAQPNTRATLEPAVRARRSGPLPGGDHSSPSGSSVPPLTTSSDGSAPRATAQSTGGAPQRATASHRHSRQAGRGRRRRSTNMTDVEMLDATTTPSSLIITAETKTQKTRDFSLATDDGGATALTAGGTTLALDVPRGGASGHEPPALKRGVLSPTVLPLPAFPSVATTHQPTQRTAPRRDADLAAAAATAPNEEVGHGAITAAAFPSAKSNPNDGPTAPSKADRNNRVLGRRRSSETTGASAAHSTEKEHVEGNVRSDGNGVLLFANVAGFNTGNKDPSHESVSYSAKQRSTQELVPPLPLKDAQGKAPAARRREYSLVIDGSPSPPPYEGQPPATERSRIHTKDYTMPSELGLEAGNRGISLLNVGRPHEPGSSFNFPAKQLNHVPVDEELRSSEEAVLLLSVPKGSSAPGSAVGAGVTTAPRQTRESAAPPRSTQRRMSFTRDDGTRDLKGPHDPEGASGAVAEGAGGRNPALNGSQRLAQPRQALAQRQRQNMVAGLMAKKEPPSSTTVLPPLAKNFVR
ncbi:putative protein kinase putativedual-specificity protein kinase [Leptomonas pyrrhocoris]|uniref:dual-specificity kinase n=1 Tax=Leptomonas pyrrhocoris TaxID=157538 RepID=A0A0N0DW13_LEPPY|nr:putative protein kinase putativedual-specificity protein kinase [Leptomonas pyrrhocoris]XP_015659588.1 putative protein kinase putativedual-specificity protein kinase [Leptomonas pyrrhocoris]KPA81148.1 putative protein kinase putativedual-specificity protein kinase [Leptomonas pyrrhocoris]KPA81149.1 putative protein kinase putativedual-specificity protein kinase [Leptomonas pyrrhocoris]|eukprot:XP_015659587.1 putative protein kinase putativedual-specificity protein kinase [Leptomonas pyrrhocoris]